MSEFSSPLRARFARRWLLYALVAVAAGGIALLRSQARRVNTAREALVVGGTTLVHDAQVPLTAGQRYLIEVVGDRGRLGELTLTKLTVIDARSRAVIMTSPTMLTGVKQLMGDGRIRQVLASFKAPGDGDYLVRLATTPAVTGETPDSFFVARAAGARDMSQSFGMMALGGVLVLLILAMGGIVGRSFLDRDAT